MKLDFDLLGSGLQRFRKSDFMLCYPKTPENKKPQGVWITLDDWTSSHKKTDILNVKILAGRLQARCVVKYFTSQAAYIFLCCVINFAHPTELSYLAIFPHEKRDENNIQANASEFRYVENACFSSDESLDKKEH